MRSFEADDLVMINEWIRARAIPKPMTIDDVPEIGIVERDVACGFLYQSDANFAWLDWMITNPHAPVVKRGRAIALIIAELTQIAQEIGFHKTYGFTERDSMRRICVKQGYAHMGNYKFMGKEL